MNLTAITPDNWLFVANLDCALFGYPLGSLFDFGEQVVEQRLENKFTLSYIPAADVENRESLPEVSINFVYSGMHDGQSVIGCVDDAGNVVLWQALAERSRIFLQNNGHISTWGMATSQHHSYVAASANNHAIRLWNTDNIADSFTLSGHHHNIPCICFVPSGTLLISASIDGTMRIWDVFGARQCLRVVRVPEEEWGWSCIAMEKCAIFKTKSSPNSSASSSSKSSLVDEGWEIPSSTSLNEGVFISLLDDVLGPESGSSRIALNQTFSSPSIMGTGLDSSLNDDENEADGSSSGNTFLSLPVASENEPISASLSIYDEILDVSGSAPSSNSEQELEDFETAIEGKTQKADCLASLDEVLLVGTNNYGVFGYDVASRIFPFNKYNIVMRNLNSRQRAFFGPIALRYVNRLNMNVWIPHVSCLATASQCGFVVISRLERSGQAVRLVPIRVLPKTPPPLCPLAGISYVPVLDSRMHLCTSVRLILVYANGALYSSTLSNTVDKFLFI